jgi:hypothetical protein
LRLPTAANWYFVAARTRPPQAVFDNAAGPTNNLTLSFQPGVITMGDHQDRPVLALLLEALVATALIGTFVVYGYPNIGPGTAAAPGEVAGLNVPE